jgi:hypothetical protein
MTLSGRARLLLALLAFVALWAALAVWAFTSGDNKPEASQPNDDGDSSSEAQDVSNAASGNKPPPTLPTIEALPAFDTSDPRRLIGFSENLFVGRVEQKVSEVPLKSTIPDSKGEPQVQFRVQVGETLKSGGPEPLSTGDRGVVDQMGGIDDKTGKPYVVNTITGGGHYTDNILQPDKEYLFATRYDPTRGFHTITAQPHGDVLLTGNEEGTATLELYRRSVKDQIDPRKVASETAENEAHDETEKAAP